MTGSGQLMPVIETMDTLSKDGQVVVGFYSFADLSSDYCYFLLVKLKLGVLGLGISCGATH